MTNDTYKRRNPKVMPSRKRVEADLSVQSSSQMWRHLGVRFPRRPITLLETGLRWLKGLGHHKQTCSNSHLSCSGHHLMQLNVPSLPFCRIIFTACRRAFWMAKARRPTQYWLHSGRYRFCIIIREGTSHREGQCFKFKCVPLHELAWRLKSHFTRNTDAVALNIEEGRQLQIRVTWKDQTQRKMSLLSGDKRTSQLGFNFVLDVFLKETKRENKWKKSKL